RLRPGRADLPRRAGGLLRGRVSCGAAVPGQANAAELPARRRWEEVAIALAQVRARRRARAAAQDELVAHELAIVLAERAGERLISRVRRVRALRPLPTFAEHLRQPIARRGGGVEAAALDEAAAAVVDGERV